MQCCPQNPEQIVTAVGPIIAVVAVLFVLAISAALLIIKAVVYCKIFAKAGYHWALGLLMLVPIACIVMPFILAFGDWPIHKELRVLRQQATNAS